MKEASPPSQKKERIFPKDQKQWSLLKMLNGQGSLRRSTHINCCDDICIDWQSQLPEKGNLALDKGHTGLYPG